VQFLLDRIPPVYFIKLWFHILFITYCQFYTGVPPLPPWRHQPWSWQFQCLPKEITSLNIPYSLFPKTRVMRKCAHSGVCAHFSYVVLALSLPDLKFRTYFKCQGFKYTVAVLHNLKDIWERKYTVILYYLRIISGAWIHVLQLWGCTGAPQTAHKYFLPCWHCLQYLLEVFVTFDWENFNQFVVSHNRSGVRDFLSQWVSTLQLMTGLFLQPIYSRIGQQNPPCVKNFLSPLLCLPLWPRVSTVSAFWINCTSIY
jgi:hypothetical protein